MGSKTQVWSDIAERELRGRSLEDLTWNTLEDHTIGFRESDEYQRWKALLHQFYDPFPTVEHYQLVAGSQILKS